jgi:peptidyl-prolyl cis-trans isomerase D
LTDVFRTDPGADTLPLTVGTDGFVWFEVRNVTPERERPLSEVRDRAVADWTADQQRQALSARTADLKGRLDKGETLAAIAEDLGLAIETKTGLRRNGEDAIFGNEAIAAAFAGPVGVAGTALGSDGESRLLLKVTAVDQATSDALAGDEQLQRMADSAGDDMLDQMVNSLKNTYGVSINQAAVNQSAAPAQY